MASTRYECKYATILFDEYHSASWTVSFEGAKVQSDNPANSSYSIAASLLSNLKFTVRRNTDRPLTSETLAGHQALALVHPCDPKTVTRRS